jgi:hypothetical protein
LFLHLHLQYLLYLVFLFQELLLHLLQVQHFLLILL